MIKKVFFLNGEKKKGNTSWLDGKPTFEQNYYLFLLVSIWAIHKLKYTSISIIYSLLTKNLHIQ
jgi:hypothetical protein